MKTPFLVLLFLASGYMGYSQSSFLDSAFGTNGMVLYHPGIETDRSTCGGAAILPDGKILAAGAALERATVISCNTDGTIDPTFAGGGIYSGPVYSAANNLTLQPDGKILFQGGGHIFRLNADGAPDNTFGSNGVDTAEITIDALALQPDGKIIMAGGETYTSMVRLLPNGTIDSAFGTNGSVVGYFGATAYGVGVIPDGRIVLGGLSFGFDFMASRYLPDGAPDTSFNHSGYATVLAGDSYNYCHAIVAQADGKVVLGGSGTFGAQGSNFALVRYGLNGAPDSSYGNAGIANIDFDNDDDELWAMCLEPDGKIIAAGYATVGGVAAFALTRINTNGSIDSSFGNNGRITTAILAGNDGVQGVTIQEDGKILASGYADVGLYPNNYPEFTLARYAIPPTTGVPQITGNSMPELLYPNPCAGKLFIKGNTDHIINITATDILGQENEIGIKPPRTEILVDGLPDGLYFFKINFDDRESSIQKILVQNKR